MKKLWIKNEPHPLWHGPHTLSRISAMVPTMCMTPSFFLGSIPGSIITCIQNSIVFWRTSFLLPAQDRRTVCAAATGEMKSSNASETISTNRKLRVIMNINSKLTAQQPWVKSLLRECWLRKETVWSRRFEQYTLLVFRKLVRIMSKYKVTKVWSWRRV